jgi:hypothetical protein
MKQHNIFISYRRDGGFETAKMIQEKLKAKNYSVFLDYEELRSGKFNEQLYDKIEKCKDFILICSPNCFDRCRNNDDWLRLEILHAIKHNKNIIPVMLRKFSWPIEMPLNLESLIHMHGIESSEALFDSFIKKLQNHYLRSKSNPFKSTTNILLIFIPILSIISIFLYLYFQPVDITIRISEAHKTENLRFEEGTIIVTYGDKTESFLIHDEVILKNIPPIYKRKDISLKLTATGYNPIDTIFSAVEYVELNVYRDKSLSKVFGVVKDEENLPLNNVQVKVLDIVTQTNEYGQFELTIPLVKQNKEQRISAMKKGYQSYDKIMPVFDDVETQIILKQ